MKNVLFGLGLLVALPFLAGAMLWMFATDLIHFAGGSRSYGKPCRPCGEGGRNVHCYVCAGSGWEVSR